jgi:HAD superfamily hydrolase (TIGR01549 family)
MVKAAIFDIDGTLVDSVNQHATAWRDAFHAFGHDIPVEAIRAQIGKGGDQLIPVFLTSAECEAQAHGLEKYRSRVMKEHYQPAIRPFPQVRALFERLRRQGTRIVLASSAKSEDLEYYKRLAEIEDLVDAEASSDDAEKSKPYPDIFQAALKQLGDIGASDTMVIGDSPYDAEAAARAGLRTIGLLCGGFPEAQLRLAGCVAIYADPADLLANLEYSPLANGRAA